MSFFGTNIKKIRHVKGLSQKAFADLFELNRGVISSYEEGRAEPKIETIIKVASHFNLNLDQLLTETLQVNQLAGISDLDQLMFNPEKIIEKNVSNQNKGEVTANERIMQKILASVDLMYEFTPQKKLLAPFHYGDILFLNNADREVDHSEELFIEEDGILEYANNKQDKNVYKIVGSISNTNKSIFTDIFKRLSILEKKILHSVTK